jgi:beta-phosphoglucomutase-like phosphatase (HAD superfamily)
VWEAFEQARDQWPDVGEERGIGTPAQLREHLKGFEEAGVDQVSFLQQGGRNRHEHICEALELFAKEVKPEFTEREEEREAAKAEELAPYIEAAFERKERMRELVDDEIPVVTAIGRNIAEGN